MSQPFDWIKFNWNDFDKVTQADRKVRDSELNRLYHCEMVFRKQVRAGCSNGGITLIKDGSLIHLKGYPDDNLLHFLYEEGYEPYIMLSGNFE